jgi:hypothetical protein
VIAVGVYFRLPGVKVRLSRRGLRIGLGPRWLRRWGGVGGEGMSSGAGPLTSTTAGAGGGEGVSARKTWL